jgi:hypothetical protein
MSVVVAEQDKKNKKENDDDDDNEEEERDHGEGRKNGDVGYSLFRLLIRKEARNSTLFRCACSPRVSPIEFRMIPSPS